MPASLSELGDDDALEAAHVAATDYKYSVPMQITLHPDQGCSSITFVAKYDDHTQSIIQLRDQPINTEIDHLAHTLLGDIVPITVPLKVTKTLYAYGRQNIPGDRWDPLIYLTVEDDAAISVQLAEIFTRCNLRLASGPVVDNYVIPRLDSAINVVEMANGPFQILPGALHSAFLERLKALRCRANNLRVLDLVLCHVDPNPLNIIIDGSSPPKIKGLIDWAGARFLPFGMNAFEIRLIAVLNVQKHDKVSDAAKPIALAFWNALVVAIPDRHKNAVLDSLEIGCTLFSLLPETPHLDKLESSPLLLRRVELFMERIAWFEEVFRHLC